MESFHACGRDKMNFAKILDAMRIELILTLDDKMSEEITERERKRESELCAMVHKHRLSLGLISRDIFVLRTYLLVFDMKLLSKAIIHITPLNICSLSIGV